MNELIERDMMDLMPLDENRNHTMVGNDVNDYLNLIQSQYSHGLVTKIPFTEIASLGGTLSAIGQVFQTSPTEPLYRCVFPQGVTGVLAKAKDGSGFLGTILKNEGGLAQARWVEAGTNAATFNPTTILIAVAILGISKQVIDIKQSQKEIIGILERDKKSQLLADYDILAKYMNEYRYYWENHITVVANLNQVKNIKRNAEKDIRSYQEQIEEVLTPKVQLLSKISAGSKIRKLLDRFVHYKLAIHVMALANYLEIMLAANFKAEYLDKVSRELNECAYQYRTLYTRVYDKIEALKKECLDVQVTGGLAKISKSVGKAIGKIPVIEKGPIDELLIAAGDSLNIAEQKKLKKTLDFFINNKKSNLIPVADHIDLINQMANEKTDVIWSDNVIYLMTDRRKAV